jgi:hypothetical protein
MKVSFDFDGTLQLEETQEYAKELIERGIDVWVVTTRYDENLKHLYGQGDGVLDDLWEVVDRLGIPRWKVRFTCMKWKGEYLKSTKFIWHLDDNHEEKAHARVLGCTVPIILNYVKDWKQKCEDLLNEKTEDLSH